MTKKPCIRCLIAQTDNKAAVKIIEDYQKSTSPDDVAEHSLYLERLSVCKDCKYLNMGVCTKCGAYVEARLYRKSGKCPLNII